MAKVDAAAFFSVQLTVRPFHRAAQSVSNGSAGRSVAGVKVVKAGSDNWQPRDCAAEDQPDNRLTSRLRSHGNDRGSDRTGLSVGDQHALSQEPRGYSRVLLAAILGNVLFGREADRPNAAASDILNHISPQNESLSCVNAGLAADR